ncbi:hypothetical protein CRM22_008514 [Opisthorchis felineus]|uniref:Uncharacterized protein n=1 Tax=Opisthorchis felineus TaxID=147828 RepID=A0A4S2LHX4_OPIFE|nr:hypothetical protein CRM22_008514 [Opisthorchis felineus]
MKSQKPLCGAYHMPGRHDGTFYSTLYHLTLFNAISARPSFPPRKYADPLTDAESTVVAVCELLVGLISLGLPGLVEACHRTLERRCSGWEQHQWAAVLTIFRQGFHSKGHCQYGGVPSTLLGGHVSELRDTRCFLTCCCVCECCLAKPMPPLVDLVSIS